MAKMASKGTSNSRNTSDLNFVLSLMLNLIYQSGKMDFPEYGFITKNGYPLFSLLNPVGIQGR
jgi:hypothetical protein